MKSLNPRLDKHTSATMRMVALNPDDRSLIESVIELAYEIGREDGALEEVRLLDTDQVAQVLQVHKQEILRYTSLGLPYYTVGKGFRFKLSDVLLFIEQFRQIEEAA